MLMIAIKVREWDNNFYTGSIQDESTSSFLLSNPCLEDFQ